MINKSVLLIESTESLANTYFGALTGCDYLVKIAASGAETLEIIELNKDFDIVILNMKLPDIDAISLLTTIKNKLPDASILIITGYGSVNIAVEAMSKGAKDFLVKPFSTDKLIRIVKQSSIYQKGLENLVSGPMQSLNHNRPKKKCSPSMEAKEFNNFTGTSVIMQKIYNVIENSAKSDATVFITGASGTGKEICAETIHKLGSRCNKPFIPINCAAIPKDLMESEIFGHTKGAFTGALSDRDGAAELANGGTLFLDEICEMPMELQSKLLRFIQTLSYKKVGGSEIKKTDIRIICATNKNPEEQVENGNFREDLYYRLHVIPISMPPLRKRGDDIVDIAYTYLLKYSKEEEKRFKYFSEETEDIFLKYFWPGNVRQLQNIIRNIVVLNDSDIVTSSMLPDYMQSGKGGSGRIKETTPDFIRKNIVNENIKPNNRMNPLWVIEKNAIELAIDECGGNIPKAAALLEVSPSTIYRKRIQWEDQEKYSKFRI